MRDLVIVGAGGHGRELYDTVRAVNESDQKWRVLGFVDDDPRHLDRVARLGLEVLGSVDWLVSHPTTYALGIGSAETRASLDSVLDAAGIEAATVVHPASHVGPDVHLEPGVIVLDRCTITTNVRVGRHTHLDVGCAVQHDSLVGDFVQASPGILINGDCEVGDHVFIGSGAIVTRGCHIGERARVGAGAVVLDDVHSGVTVAGIPARPIGA